MPSKRPGQRCFGYDSPGEAIAVLDDWGHQVWLDPAERTAFVRVLEQHGQAVSSPCQFRRKDGTLLWGIITASKICGPGGETLNLTGFLEDVTERKTSRDALQSAEQQYREIFEFAPEVIFRIAPGGQLLTINPAAATTFGFESTEEIYQGKNLTSELLVDPHDREVAFEMVEKTGAIYRHQCRMKRRDGTLIWIAVSARKITGADGKTLYYQGFMEDITEQKLLELGLSKRSGSCMC